MWVIVSRKVWWNGRSLFSIFSVIVVLILISLALNLSLYSKISTNLNDAIVKSNTSATSVSDKSLVQADFISSSLSINVKRKLKASTKLILLYTSFFGNEGILGWNAIENTFTECPFNCRLTANKQLINESDALVYHPIRRDTANRNQLSLPRSHHLNHQIWVFYLLESPANWITQWSMRKYNDVFNWTVTYRRDSDVPWPYGKFLERRDGDEPHEIPTLSSIKSKQLVAGMASRCKRAVSGREAYIRNLQKYIPVAYYGACGDLNCSQKLNCYEHLSKRYKFWLAFENAFCVDYVTEKFFNALYYGMVPVVYGFVNYSEIAPANSFINTNDFNTPKELALYLRYLDQHPAEYLKYFNWKKQFRVLHSSSAELRKMKWCAFCAKLHEANNASINGGKAYKNIENWYRRDSSNKSVCVKTYTDVHNTSKFRRFLKKTKKEKSKRKERKEIRKYSRHRPTAKRLN